MQRTQGAYYDLLPYEVTSWGTPQFILFVNYHSYIHVFITEGGQDKKGKFHKVSNFMAEVEDANKRLAELREFH